MAGGAAQDRSRVPAAVEPMLATPDGGTLRDGPGYAYEFKWDGSERVRGFPQALSPEPAVAGGAKPHCPCGFLADAAALEAG